MKDAKLLICKLLQQIACKLSQQNKDKSKLYGDKYVAIKKSDKNKFHYMCNYNKLT